jgi:hypothetical protein
MSKAYSAKDRSHRELSPEVTSMIVAVVVSIVVIGLAFIGWAVWDSLVSVASRHYP